MNKMIYLLLVLWLFLAFCIIGEKRNIRIVIYLCVFSFISSISFLILGSPDAAMAEAAIGTFTGIFFIICFEKHRELRFNEKNASVFSRDEDPPDIDDERAVQALLKLRKKARARTRGKHNAKSILQRYLAPGLFSILLFILFIVFLPGGEANPYLRNQFLTQFSEHVGGENAVTAIYLAYRVYDTLFEALVLVIAVVAVIHMSYSSDILVKGGKPSHVGQYVVVVSVLRVICAIVLLFGFYLIMNGHITAGGGFQGGLFIAAFFICRYLVYDIYDLPITKVIRMEELVFLSTVIFAVLIVFLGTINHLPPVFHIVYMIVMNFLIGLKVACGFLILFYRYIAIERR